MTDKVRCIYCAAIVDPNRGQGDHIIPASLGEFRGDTPFRRICPSCNSRIGAAEQQLVQSGPEGFLRQIVGPRSKRMERRGKAHLKGAMGAPPPAYGVQMEDHYALVSPLHGDPLNVEPVDHLLLRNSKGEESAIRLHPQMRLEQLRSLVRGSGLTGTLTAFLHCSEDHLALYEDLLSGVWPQSHLIERPPTPAGVHESVPCRVTFTVTDAYFRAVAKIAFHYYLAHSSRGRRGDEQESAPIRDFIMNGGDVDAVFADQGEALFATPFHGPREGWTAVPVHWCHIIAAGEVDGRAMGYVQLFVGPRSVPPPYHVRLGRRESRILLPPSVTCHEYAYDAPQKPGRYCGAVRSLSASPLRRR